MAIVVIGENIYVGCYKCKHYNYCKFRDEVIKWFENQINPPVYSSKITKDMSCDYYSYDPNQFKYFENSILPKLQNK